MAPNQPTHNMQDDLSPGTAKDASTTDTGAGGARFEHLQRAYRAGGVLPEYPADNGTVPGKLAGSGQS
jgi:hypothetical protein